MGFIGEFTAVSVIEQADGKWLAEVERVRMDQKHAFIDEKSFDTRDAAFQFAMNGFKESEKLTSSIPGRYENF